MRQDQSDAASDTDPEERRIADEWETRQLEQGRLRNRKKKQVVNVYDHSKHNNNNVLKNIGNFVGQEGEDIKMRQNVRQSHDVWKGCFPLAFICDVISSLLRWLWSLPLYLLLLLDAIFIYSILSGTQTITQETMPPTNLTVDMPLVEPAPIDLSHLLPTEWLDANTHMLGDLSILPPHLTSLDNTLLNDVITKIHNSTFLDRDELLLKAQDIQDIYTTMTTHCRVFEARARHITYDWPSKARHFIITISRIPASPSHDHLRASEVTKFARMLKASLVELTLLGNDCHTDIATLLTASTNVSAIFEREFNSARVTKNLLHKSFIFAAYSSAKRNATLAPLQARMKMALDVETSRLCWEVPVKAVLNATVKAVNELEMVESGVAIEVGSVSRDAGMAVYSAATVVALMASARDAAWWGVEGVRSGGDRVGSGGGAVDSSAASAVAAGIGGPGE